MERKYKLYFHINNFNGEVFYVGMGIKRRPYDIKKRNNWWNHLVDKYGYDIIIEEDNLTQIEAFELERYWIKRIGRRDLGLGTLVNLTDGGEGSVGYKHTKETLLKISGENNPSFGKKLTDEHKLKCSEALKGRLVSEETRLKISIAQKGVKRGPSKKRGITLSDEQKKKMSDSKKGKPWTQARIDAQKNRNITDVDKPS